MREILLNSSRKSWLFELFLSSALVGVLLGIINVYIVLLLFFLHLFTVSQKTAGVILILFASNVLGAFSQFMQLPIPGAVICYIIGLILLRKDIVPQVIGNKRSFLFLLVILSMFIFYFLLGPQTTYSKQKLFGVTIVGMITLFGYLLIFTSFQINNKDISESLFIISLLYLSMAFDFAGFNRPSSINDLSFFRESFETNKIGNDYLVSYQSLGLSSMIAVAFLICSSNAKIFYKQSILLMVSLSYLAIISQARQAVFGILILLVIRVILSGKGLKLKILFVLTICIVSLLFLNKIDVGTIQTSLNWNQDISLILNRDYTYAISSIQQNPIFGKGLGGYSSSGLRVYPHNIFLEVLAEFGIIGLIALIYIVVKFLYPQHVRFNVKAANDGYFVIIIFSLLIRALISSDLIENIALLTSLLAINISSIKIEQNYRNEFDEY